MEGRFNGGFLHYDFGGLIFGGAYFRNFTVSQPVFTAAWKATVAQKGHRCKLKMLLQIKNSTCKLKIVHAN